MSELSEKLFHLGQTEDLMCSFEKLILPDNPLRYKWGLVEFSFHKLKERVNEEDVIIQSYLFKYKMKEFEEEISDSEPMIKAHWEKLKEFLERYQNPNYFPPDDDFSYDLSGDN